jgi:hypothetical protein
LIAPLIDALEPRTIVEIGAGSGDLTRKLLVAPGAARATIHAVDPAPALDPELVEGAGERLRIHPERAIDAIDGIDAADLAILDGDPNWYETYHEMTMLINAAKRAGRPAPLFAVHHIHWPFGRRDGYHDPDAIPEAHRHQYTDLGLVPSSREPTPEGLRLTPYCAVRDFEPRSGVLTGVKDAIADSDLEWTVVELPGFNGCAVLAEAALLEEKPALGDVIERFRGAAFHAQQARRAESARVAAEVELATAWAAEADDGPSPGAEETAAENGSSKAGPPEIYYRLAQETAQRESVEWRLQRLDEDQARMQARLDALQKERDEIATTSAETRVLLQRATEELAAERSTADTLRKGIADLEETLGRRQHELDRALERAKGMSGRLSQYEDAMQALSAESERLRKRVKRLSAGLGNARALLHQAAVQIEWTQSRRGARFRRGLRRAGRIVTLRASSPVREPLDRLRELTELAWGSLYDPADLPAERAEPVASPAPGEAAPTEFAKDGPSAPSEVAEDGPSAPSEAEEDVSRVA